MAIKKSLVTFPRAVINITQNYVKYLSNYDILFKNVIFKSGLPY